MESLLLDIRSAVHTLVRNARFTLIAVLTLALGVGATTAIFGLADSVLLRPLPVVDAPERLVAIYTSDFSSGIYGASSYPDYLDYREQASAFADLAAFSGFALGVNLSADGEADRIDLGFATSDYFETLGVAPAVGRALLPAEGDPAGARGVVLSYALWQRRFGGTPEAIGRTVRLNEQVFTIVGVAPANFHGTQLAAAPDAWAPMGAAGALLGAADILDDRGSRWLGMIGRLAPDATLDQAAVQIRTIAAQLAEAYPDTNLGTLQAPDAARPMTLVPARAAAIDPAERGTLVRVASLLGAAGLFVLLIACANLATLELARSARRTGEIALRVSLGATRARVIRQQLVRSSLLALAAGAAGVLFALVSADLILASGFAEGLIDADAVPASTLDYRLLGFALVVSLAAGIAFGLMPALRASRAQLVFVLKEGVSRAGTPRRGFDLRGILVVCQVALALVLLIGAGLFIESLRETLAVDRGYALERALIASVDLGGESYDENAGSAFLDALKERIEAQPQVTAAAYARLVPVDPFGGRRGVIVDGYAPRPGEDMEINYNVVGRDYFRTLGIALLRGRGFLVTDGSSSPPVAVINETFARRYFGSADPIGRVLRLGGPDADPVTVVGIARDGKYRSLHEAPLPYLYLPLSQNYSASLNLIVATRGDPLSLTPMIRAEVARLDADLPLFAVQTLRQHLGVLVATERTVTALVLAFGLVALLLAALGIYGLMAFLVAQRTREIGIRIALGAGTASVLRLVLGRGTALTVIGSGLGLVASLVATRALSTVLYGAGTIEPAVYAGMTFVLAGVAVVACYIPAKRAANVDPTAALREE